MADTGLTAMKKPELADYQRLSDSREVPIKRVDLPLHCPTDDSAVWCAHPRVFLAIEDSDDKTARCPYCGTHMMSVTWWIIVKTTPCNIAILCANTEVVIHVPAPGHPELVHLDCLQ